MKKFFLNHLFITIVIVLVSFTACNNPFFNDRKQTDAPVVKEQKQTVVDPESDGIKAAKEYCNCEQLNIDFIELKYSEFIKNIDSYKFQTPAEGRLKVQEIDNMAKKSYNDCIREADKNFSQLNEKYYTNEALAPKFEFAFQRTKEKCKNKGNNISLSSQIDSLIWSVFFSTADMIFVQGNGRISDFYIGKYEITQKQWETVMGNNPSAFKRGDNYPVEQVSWNDVQEFLRKINSLTGQQYRLPTSSEWEYAARGGNKSRGYTYSGSNTINEVAWYKENSGRSTTKVGEKKPNELGIYDMSGNVWEWCQDKEGSHRATRGGSFSDVPSRCRISFRFNDNPNARYSSIGFRIVISK